MPPPIVVAKLGGSLLPWPGLPAALSAFVASRSPSRLVLVAGGGAIVDVLRDLDRLHHLGEERSHALALRAMDLTARILASLLPDSRVVDSLDSLPPCWDLGLLPVFAPRRFLDLDDRSSASPLPHRWDVTSDSIAARLASRLSACELVLLKSTAAPPGLDLDALASLGLVDPTFPEAARGLPLVSVLNLRSRTPDQADRT